MYIYISIGVYIRELFSNFIFLMEVQYEHIDTYIDV